VKTSATAVHRQVGVPRAGLPQAAQRAGATGGGNDRAGMAPKPIERRRRRSAAAKRRAGARLPARAYRWPGAMAGGAPMPARGAGVTSGRHCKIRVLQRRLVPLRWTSYHKLCI
jgi:hypothetical protein